MTTASTSHSFDAVIIGAGIMGCCTAFELSTRGLRVALLEKETIGAGSTGRSSAIIRQHYSNELTARMALHSLHVFQDFQEQIGDECGFRQTGFVALVAAKDRAGLEANVALQRSVGIRTELLQAEALLEVIPDLEIADVVAAAYEPESGYADPHLTVYAYANAARRLGAQIFLDTPAIDVRFAGDRVVGVTTPAGRFDAPSVVNCGGPWGAEIGAMANLRLPINPCRVQVAVFHRPQAYGATHPVVVDFIHASYFRSETGCLTLVGLIDPAEANAVVDPDNYHEHIDPEFVTDVGERFLRRYPPMELAESRGGFAGLYAITPDWHPIVDEVPAGSGHFVCAGFGGHGFKLGPAVGIMVADMLIGEREPTFDPALFRLARYAEKDTVRGQYEYSIAG